MSDLSILRNSSLSQIRQLQHVVILKDNTTVEHVLKTLASHRIVAAPVISHEDTVEEGHYGSTWPMNKVPEAIVGFVDVKIIIKRFLESIKDSGIIQMKSMLKKMRSLEEKGHEFCLQTIKEANLLSADGSFLDASAGAITLLQFADEALLSFEKREEIGPLLRQIVHRVALLDSSKKIANIISQSDIVRFLFEKCEEFKEIADKTISEIGFTQKEIISVPPEMSAVEALKVINDNNIGAVAVINSDGCLIGNFSAADMRTITPEHFGSLALPVGEFIALEHGFEYVGYAVTREEGGTVDQLNGETNGKPEDETDVSKLGVMGHEFARNRSRRKEIRTPGYDVGQELVVCHPTSKFREVIENLVKNHIHRIFVVDENTKPIGIVTDTDVLRKLVEIAKAQN